MLAADRKGSRLGSETVLMYTEPPEKEGKKQGSG
jgi:hypothetical protein